ncbi:hypothetical protein B0H63DRAFT_558410 [Podospora didyma]|uniref:Uncharacterized protein n=1 Tax=Podospora didyma TaxID=330526 RepID=A0AAE0NSN0_9PEZI|nr:hypothetical protein B0H63DRAFT_558410 [Podospora didyma]
MMLRQMNGLWKVETYALPPGGRDHSWGLVVWDILVWIWLTTMTCLSISCRSQHWRILRLLHAGMVLLSVWYFLHFINLLIHQVQAPVSYGYILVPAVFNTTRTLSEVLILPGLWLALKRCRSPSVSSLVVSALTGVLWFLGLYQLGLDFSLCFAWLGFSDVGTINKIAQARSGIDVTFSVVYFLAGLAMMSTELHPEGPMVLQKSPPPLIDDSTVRDVQHLNNSILDVQHLDESASNMMISKLYDLESSALYAGLILCVRSFCEVVIVGQLDRAPNSLQTILVARDVCYGLWTACFAFFVAIATPSRFDKVYGDKDLWDEDRKEAVRQQAAEFEKATADCRAVEATLMTWLPELEEFLKRKLDEVTEGGIKTAPSIQVVLDELQRAIIPPLPTNASGYDAKLHAAQHYEIKKLKERFKEWEPITKWDSSSVSEVEGHGVTNIISGTGSRGNGAGEVDGASMSVISIEDSIVLRRG